MMLNLSLKILLAGLILSHTASAIELEQFPDSHKAYLASQESQDDLLYIEDAYISDKYVGGLWIVVTFSVPKDSYEKTVYLVIDRYNTQTSRFAESHEDLKFNRGNTLWIGDADGRSRFVMRVPSKRTGHFELYVKTATTQYDSRFELRHQSF